MDFIGIENFRSLSGWHKFDLADITLLTGTNNSGKSSLISAVRILKDGIRGGDAEMYTQQIERSWSAFKIENIFNIELNNKGDKRSGGFLSTLINRDQIKKDRLSFSFQGNVDYIDKPFEIILTIKISLNNLDIGLIDEILFKDLTDNKIFLKIGTYENRKPTIKIDLRYFTDNVRSIWIKGKDFYHRLSEMNNILMKGGNNSEQIVLKLIAEFEKDFNKKVTINKKGDIYQVDAQFDNPFNLEFISTEDAKNLFDLIKANRLYEFHHFLKYQKEGMTTFEEILSYYKEDSIEAKLKLFSKDFVDHISKFEWILDKGSWSMDSIGYILKYEKEFDKVGECLSLVKICDLLSNVIGVFDRKLKKKSLTKEILLKSNIIKNIAELYNESPDFFDSVMIPFINIIVNMSNDNKLHEIKRNIYEEVIATLIEYVHFKLQVQLRQLDSSKFITSSRSLSSDTFRNAETGEFQQMLQKLYALDAEQKDSATWFISKWLQEFDIADDFILKVDPSYGSYQAYLIINEVELPITEFGFGTVQLLPLILGISIHNTTIEGQVNGKYLFVEEPESNLHPALQSKLADMFVEAISIFKIRLVVETHSEYLIRKLQYLIAKGDAKPESAVIYYFNKADDPRVRSGMKERVVKITINEDGHLSDDFGPGFIDEANNISISLFGLNQRNKN